MENTMTLTEKAAALFLARNWGNLVDLRADGSPHVTPVWVVDEGADEHIDKLAKKYLGVDEYPFRSPGEQRVIIRITPERVDLHGVAE